jgi:hypothetical protein
MAQGSSVGLVFTFGGQLFKLTHPGLVMPGCSYVGNIIIGNMIKMI